MEILFSYFMYSCNYFLKTSALECLSLVIGVTLVVISLIDYSLVERQWKFNILQC